MPYLKQALSRVFIHQPKVYFSQRLLSRQAFPQLFTKLDDGTLCLKEQEAYSHFHQKTNVYHLIPAESDAHSSKDVQRQLKLNLFDSQILRTQGSVKLLESKGDTFDILVSPDSSDFAFAVVNATSPLVESQVRQIVS